MAEVLWYYAQDDEQKGPISGAELRQLASSGKLSAQDLIWKEGMAEWVPAQKVKGLFPEGKTSTKPASAPASSAAAQPAAAVSTVAPPERSVGPDFSEIESNTNPPEPIADEPPPAPEVATTRRSRPADSTVSVSPRKAHAHHGSHAKDGSGLLKGLQSLLWIACGFVVLVGGVLLTIAIVKAKEPGEQAAAGATYSAFFIGAYIVARAGEKLAELLRGKP